MNNEEENIKKLISALADLVIVWMINIERKQSKTKGIAQNENQRIQLENHENHENLRIPCDNHE